MEHYEWVITQKFKHVFNTTFPEEFSSEEEYKKALVELLKKEFEAELNTLSKEERPKFFEVLVNTEFDDPFQNEVLSEVISGMMVEDE